MTPPISTLALWRSFRRLLALLLLLLALALATGAAVVVQASRSDAGGADAAVVMLDVGATPRVDRARQLYSEGKISRILLAGADLDGSRNTLESRGVKEEAIIMLQEPDQLRQLRAAKRTLEQEHLRSALLIAEPVETLRLLKIAHDVDLRLQSTPVGARPDISIGGIAREVGRYFGYVLLGK